MCRSNRAWEPVPPSQRLCLEYYISTENLRVSLAEVETEPFGQSQVKKKPALSPGQRLRARTDFACPWLRIVKYVAGFAGPLGVKLFDRPPDAEAPRKLAVILVSVRNHVALHGLFHRDTGLVRFSRLFGDVVKAGAHFRDAFLTKYLAVAGNEERAAVEGCKLRERRAPLCWIPVDVDRVLPANQQTTDIHDILFRHAEDQVGVRMADIGFDYDVESAEVNLHRHFRGIERMIGQGENRLPYGLEHTGQALNVALCVFALIVRLGFAHSFFPQSEECGLVFGLPFGIDRGHARGRIGVGPHGGCR